jgi:hypothetical protein
MATLTAWLLMPCLTRFTCRFRRAEIANRKPLTVVSAFTPDSNQLSAIETN